MVAGEEKNSSLKVKMQLKRRGGDKAEPELITRTMKKDEG